MHIEPKGLYPGQEHQIKFIKRTEDTHVTCQFGTTLSQLDRSSDVKIYNVILTLVSSALILQHVHGQVYNFGKQAVIIVQKSVFDETSSQRRKFVPQTLASLQLV